MAVGKCVHKGCGKAFSDENEECLYHPGPPVFHEGQKGWKCCKPRVLTFDEFMEIPPCTTGKHSTVDDTPAPAPSETPAAPEPAATAAPKPQPASSSQPDLAAPTPRLPVSTPATPRPTASPAPPEDESDDPDTPIPTNATCKRKSCGVTYKGDNNSDRSTEECIHHPGQPVFHEGSKGWTCCKRRVLEFDEFLKIAGCKTKKKHLFVGAKKDDSKEEVLETVRSDFYQTTSTVMASLYLKKIDKAVSTVEFVSPTVVRLDLRTEDKKRFKQDMPLYGPIDPEKSTFKIMGTKLEFQLTKADGSGWPVLRGDDRPTGEIIQTGRAGRA